MPYYDYKCEKCEKESEIFHSLLVESPPCHICGGKLCKQYKSSPPDIASSMRVQKSIDSMRSNIR